MRFTRSLSLLLLAAASCGVGHSDERARADAAAALATPGGADSFPLAPALRGVDSRGGAFSLAALRGDAVVLLFYRSDSCPLCRERLAAADAHLDAYRRAGARVIAVTPDPPEIARRTAEALALGVPIISAERSTLEQWGVWLADEHAPRPAAIVIDREGRIRFRHVGRTAADRAHDPDLLAVLRRVRGSGADERGR